MNPAEAQTAAELASALCGERGENCWEAVLGFRSVFRPRSGRWYGKESAADVQQTLNVRISHPLVDVDEYLLEYCK